MAKFKARVCKKCRGDGALHKPGDPSDILCQWCPPPKPSVARKWSPGESCIMDDGKVGSVKGVLVKAPFLSQYKEWFVIVATVDECMSPKDEEYYQRRFNVRILKKRVTLA